MFLLTTQTRRRRSRRLVIDETTGTPIASLTPRNPPHKRDRLGSALAAVQPEAAQEIDMPSIAYPKPHPIPVRVADECPAGCDLSRAALRRFSDSSLTASDLAEEIDYWNRQRALWQGDLTAGDVRDTDEAALRGGIAFAEARLHALRRQAQRHLRAHTPAGSFAHPRQDFTARFAAAKWVDLVGLAEAVTGQEAATTGNGRYQLRCPFHDDATPSLVIYPPGKGWHCFGCGRGGDAVAFVSERFHVGAVEALRVVEHMADTAPAVWERAS
jgi:hypothetical protein